MSKRSETIHCDKYAVIEGIRKGGKLSDIIMLTYCKRRTWNGEESL
uniref:Uncharacterized protein n=1 Tax=Anguilla anguilla TaxID=7936 RepID=A0A0E9PE69_ANGAN